MKNSELEISRAQFLILNFDLESCKLLAKWLFRLILLRETEDTMLDKTIDDLGLSNKAYKVLKRNGINTLHQLNVLSYNWKEVKVLEGVGPITIQELQRKFYEFKNTYNFKKNALIFTEY